MNEGVFPVVECGVKSTLLAVLNLGNEDLVDHVCV